MVYSVRFRFTVEELVHLVNKVNLKVNSLFRGNLNPCRSSMGKGYMETFLDWLASMRAGRQVKSCTFYPHLS